MKKETRDLLSGFLALLIPLTGIFFYEYLFVHMWLGYPLVPGTVTNEFWELVWINLQILFWVLVFFIPSLIMTMLTWGVFKLGVFLTKLALELVRHRFARA